MNICTNPYRYILAMNKFRFKIRMMFLRIQGVNYLKDLSNGVVLKKGNQTI